ncbi:MAG: GNAT family N-acetyltransferase [Vulcanisaeta sp.]
MASGIADNNPEVNIRKAEVFDIPQIIDFTRNTFSWGDYLPNVINEWVRAGTAYVAVAHNEVVGVINIELLPTGVAWLEGLRVKPSHRRIGVGTALTKFVMDHARRAGAKYAMLMIAEWNEASHNLAHKLGFKPVLRVHAGIAKESSTIRETNPERIREVIRQALDITGGYLCTGNGHWICTRATIDYALSLIKEVYVGDKGVGFDIGFSIGLPTTPVKMEVLSTDYGDFDKYYGVYIVYELRL